jgi:hypothetical protein
VRQTASRLGIKTVRCGSGISERATTAQLSYRIQTDVISVSPHTLRDNFNSLSFNPKITVEGKTKNTFFHTYENNYVSHFLNIPAIGTETLVALF